MARCGPASSALTPGSKPFASPTRAVMSWRCPSWVKWFGARRSTASNSPCKACFRRRARPSPSSKPTGAWPIIPACSATAFPEPATPTLSMARRLARRWTKPGSPVGPTAAAPGWRSRASATMRWGSARTTAPRRASCFALTARSVRSSWRSRTSRRRRWSSCTCATSTSLSRRARESCSLFRSRRSMSSREQRSPATSFRPPNIAN